MNYPFRLITSFAGLSLVAMATAQAGVTASVDGTTTSASTSWAGSPAGSPSLSLLNPNQATSVDGNFTDGVIFNSASSFNLGAFEFYGYVSGGGTGTYNLSLYNLGSSLTIPTGGGATVYTFSGSEVNLFSAGLNVSLTTPNNPGQFNVLSFSGADQVALAAGNSYMLVLSDTSGGNLIFDRGAPGNTSQDLTVSTLAPGTGVAMNNVPAGQRLPVSAVFAATVPEPSTFALAGVGLGALLAFRRRRA